MALKEWFVSNGVFDKNLMRVFPRYGINDPVEDLKKLTPSQWKEIKTEQLRERAAELKSSSAIQRHQQKLTKIEKLWKLSRSPPKRKTKSQKSKSLAVIKKKKHKTKSTKSKIKEEKEENEQKEALFIEEIENLKKKNKDIQKERNNLILEFNLFKKVHKNKLDQLNHNKISLNKEWEKKYNTKEIEFREIQKVYNKYKQLNYDHNNKKITIEAQMKDLSQNNEKLIKEINEIKQLNVDLEFKLNKNKTLTEEMNKKYTELDVKYTLIDNEKTEFDSKQNELRDDMHQVKDYNKLLKSNLAEMEEKNKEIRDLADNHKEEKIESDNKLSLKIKECNHLQIKYAQVMDDYEQLRNECDVLQNECSQLKIEYNKRTEQTEEPKQIKIYKNKMKELKEEIAKKKPDKLMQENESLKERINKMLKMEQDLNELIKKKGIRIKKLEKKNSELEKNDLDETINHRSDIVALQNENEELKHSYNKIKRKYDILYETQNEEYDINELVQENKRLKSKLKKSQRTATLTDIIENLDNNDELKVYAMNEELESIRNERNTLRDLCNEMRIFIEANQLTYNTSKHDRSRSKSKAKLKKQKSRDSKTKSKTERPRTESKVKKKHKQKEDENIVPETYLTAFD